MFKAIRTSYKKISQFGEVVLAKDSRVEIPLNCKKTMIEFLKKDGYKVVSPVQLIKETENGYTIYEV